MACSGYCSFPEVLGRCEYPCCLPSEHSRLMLQAGTIHVTRGKLESDISCAQGSEPVPFLPSMDSASDESIGRRELALIPVDGYDDVGARPLIDFRADKERPRERENYFAEDRPRDKIGGFREAGPYEYDSRVSGSRVKERRSGARGSSRFSVGASQEVAAIALIEASARNKNTPNEYENRVIESRSGGTQLRRVAKYLPPRITKQRSGLSRLNVSYFGAVIKLATGGFLTLSEENTCSGPVDDIKQEVFDENVNLAVISALMLTLVVPMFFESWEDYLEEDLDGSTLFLESYIGSRLDQEKVQSLTRLAADIGHCVYLLSAVGFLFSTLACVYILLCVNEIGSDNGVQVFLRQMGRAIQLPYMFFSVGMVCFAAIVLRSVFTARSLEANIIEMALAVLATVCFTGVSQTYCVQCTCHALHEIKSYDPLALTPAEVHADVELYLQNAGASAEMADCLFALQARTPTGALVSLSSVTTALVKAAYRRKVGEWMGLDVSDSAIYQITRNDSDVTLFTHQ